MAKTNRLKMNCHHCKNCTNKHNSDKDIPNAFCNIHNCIVIEYHTLCDEFTCQKNSRKLDLCAIEATTKKKEESTVA